MTSTVQYCINLFFCPQEKKPSKLATHSFQVVSGRSRITGLIQAGRFSMQATQVKLAAFQRSLVIRLEEMQATPV